MMLTLTTAKELNIKNRLDPASSIRGGAEYFVKQWHRLPETITEPDRSWFALAAYNVGYGHLKDAWQVAEFQGNDPTRWDNVSKSLPLLANKKWYPFFKSWLCQGLGTGNLCKQHSQLLRNLNLDYRQRRNCCNSG